MAASREVRLRRENVGRLIRFDDGTEGRVYRETCVAGLEPEEPCFLVVRFRLRHVHGRGHVLFRLESILNTPLFVGFPGFVSKLWLAHDERGFYRGLYEWDGVERAERYARSLWRVLALVSEQESIDFRVVPGLRRDDAIATPALLAEWMPAEAEAWWRVASAAHEPAAAINEIMSTRIVAIRSDCDLRVAVDTFLRTALRHLIVVDEDRNCLGVINSEQVLAAINSSRDRRVGGRVVGQGLRVHQDASVRRAAQLMVDELVDALPVVDDSGRVVGIVTWSDIVRMVARRELLA